MPTACTILCPIADFAGVFAAIRDIYTDEIRVVGPPEKWEQICIRTKHGTLTLSSLIRVVPGDKFSKLVRSMLTFVRAIETDVESNKEHLFGRFEQVELMIGVVAEPEFCEDDDRLDIVWRVADSVDAVVFNGNAILDPLGQRILDRNGEFDVIVG